MLTIIDFAWIAIGFMAGAGLATKFFKPKILALQDQVNSYVNDLSRGVSVKSSLCSNCLTVERLKNAEAEIKALDEERVRLKRSNSQFRKLAEIRRSK